MQLFHPKRKGDPLPVSIAQIFHSKWIVFFFLIHYLNSRDIKVMRGDGTNGTETPKGTKEKLGAKSQLWRKCGGGGVLVKGNQPGKSEPNQRPFLQWNWTRSRKYDKGETMQIKKEMKHAVAIGLFIQSWNPQPMHPPPSAPYCLRTPLSSDLQNYKLTQTPCCHLLLHY